MKKNITISNLMENISVKIPNKEIFVFPETKRRYTFKEFEEKIEEAAKGLIAAGVTKDSHVGLWMDNIEEWFILFFAINKIGAISVPINPKYNVDEMGYILNKFDIDTLFMSEGFKCCHIDVSNILFKNDDFPGSKYPRLKKIITIGFETRDFKSDSYDDFIKQGKNIDSSMVKKINQETSAYDNAIILPTSGTTGFSKGVQLNNIQLIKNGYDIGKRYRLNAKDKLLIQVPMVHCFGITLSMLAALTHITGMCVISQFNPEIALDAIENEKITSINGVPSMYNDIINNSSFQSHNISSLKKGIMAGSNCYPEFIKKVSDAMKMKIISVYGLSEASPGCTMSSIKNSKSTRTNTVGRALPGVKCKIIDPQTGKKVRIGQEGEFIARGYNIMQGYYNDEVETTQTIDDRGFLHSGDIVKKLYGGNYFVIGRIKDVIIRGGENIYPGEIERIIAEIPGVSEVCVAGISDDKLGQVAVALVVIDNPNITTEYIKDYMKTRCAKYKIPKYIIFVPEIIKNTARKPMKELTLSRYFKNQ